tara:strand:+ start:9504 stop:10922 length:1419 start_codon:yes stop_codon:yes gene_type:complete
MYLGSALKKKNHKVEILDLRLKKNAYSRLNETIKKFKPDIVGVGLLTVESKSAHQIVKDVKTIDPELIVIFGGPHCEAEPDLILKDNNIDILVIGEGENTICELMDVFKNNGSLDKVNGIAYRDKGNIIKRLRGRNQIELPPWMINEKTSPKNKFLQGNIVKTDRRGPIEDLNSLKLDYGLLNVEDYFHFSSSHDYLPSSKRFLPIFTSRGCPFECVYCHNIFGKKIRYMSAERVFKEIDFLYKEYNVEEFHFLDDSFNIDINRAKRIFDLICDSGMKIRITFPNGIRADFLDEELIYKMKKAGVYRVALGIESASERIMKMIDKKSDINEIKVVTKKLSSSKISTGGFFMLGFPTETREEISNTINFACSLDLTTAIFSLVIPNPGTKLWKSIKNNDRNFDPDDFENFNAESVNLNQSCVSSKELLKLQRTAYRKFYLTPWRIWKIYVLSPDKIMVIRKFISKLKFIVLKN